MARIAVDMDEVIADFNAKFIPALNARFNKQLTLAHLHGTKAEQVFPELAQKIKDMIGEADFSLIYLLCKTAKKYWRKWLTSMKFLLQRLQWNFLYHSMPNFIGCNNIFPLLTP